MEELGIVTSPVSWTKHGCQILCMDVISWDYDMKIKTKYEIKLNFPLSPELLHTSKTFNIKKMLVFRLKEVLRLYQFYKKYDV